MSAPKSIGLHRYGVATVLSTIKGIPCLCAISANFFKSIILPKGLPIDSQ